jgi:biopolymer transport protein ExbB
MGNFLLFIRDNFFHVVPIIAAGVIAIAIIVERTWMLMWVYPLTNPNWFFEKIRDQVLNDRIADAIAFCDRHPHKLVAEIVRSALLRAHQPETIINDGLDYAVTEAMEKIRHRTTFLSTIANVATLLGLFGTIVGLIHSFESIGNANAQMRSALLSAGISTAMNATMMGLAVAIPCMVAFSFLMNRSNTLITQVDKASIRVLDIIKQRHYSVDMESSARPRPKAV